MVSHEQGGAPDGARLERSQDVFLRCCIGRGEASRELTECGDEFADRGVARRLRRQSGHCRGPSSSRKSPAGMIHRSGKKVKEVVPSPDWPASRRAREWGQSAAASGSSFYAKRGMGGSSAKLNMKLWENSIYGKQQALFCIFRSYRRDLSITQEFLVNVWRH